MKTSFGLFLCIVTLLVSLGAASACTTLNLQSGDVNIFGRNYDWSLGDGVVIVNKRGLVKTAMTVKDETGAPATWQAKYGSVTFNQYGREFPQGGINEAGLVVEIMAVPEGAYPVPDSRPYIGKAQYRQYLLDRFATVQEVIAGDALVRISSSGKGPMTHLLVSDRSGASAVIEFIGGTRVVYTGDTLPVRALSNSPYAASLGYWQRKQLPATDPLMSVARFVRAADAASAFDAKAIKAPVEHTFDILKQVTQGDRTRWSIVYDIANLRVAFRTAANPQPRSLDLKRTDFSCKSPVQMVDIDAGSGDISPRFQAYTPQANRQQIGTAFGKTDFLKGIPAPVIDAIAAYPDTAKCEQL